MSAGKDSPYHFILQLEGGPDSYPEELDQATRSLRRELLDMQVERVDWIRSNDAPAGTKSGEMISLGTMAVTVLPIFISKFVDLLQTWVNRHEGKIVKIKTKAGNRSIEVEFSQKTLSKEDLIALLKTLNQSLDTRDQDK